MTNQTADISAYLKEIDKLYRSGKATEHSYRPALQNLLEKITAGLSITNEPKHIACGAPDYIVAKSGIPLGYIEAKDIPVGIDNKQNKEQFDRYCQSLNNLIITDYLSFRLFVDGEPVIMVSIAAENNGGITPDKKQFPAFLELINQFTRYSGKTIYNSEQLAKVMADKAKLLALIIKTALQEKTDGNSIADDTLSGQYEGFKKILIHNLDIAEFADIYAQTLAYGLFAARLNQRDNQTFTRYLAPHLIPQSNPFLRNFFNYIAGINLDSRITWIVDALADIFNCVAVEEIIKEFDKAAQDPYIHFYETFLAEYDPALREMRGVYYTPVPVVKFIVEAVDEILKADFNLKNGLADYSKIKQAFKNKDGKSETVELHKVQILDPATGTGTFLAAVIDKIYSYLSRKLGGAWNDYCENHLVPRLHGFEILMASYAMAHFKLDMKLKETGFSWNNDESRRLNVYLTNTLEEAPENVPDLFMAQWLAKEAEEAGRIKRDAPVMVVIANPPYNVSTQNKNEWIDNLITDYKKDLHEKKINLDDDYIKFIRYGQYLIEKNGFGILAYISNNSFIDGITHRQMRNSLLKTFEKIYVLDLHGNANKREKSPDGSVDENVFDIRQGVSINIFIKANANMKSISKVFHSDIYGTREYKYSFLLGNSINTISWNSVNLDENNFFAQRNFTNKDDYNNGFRISDLFPIFSNGVETQKDAASIKFNKDECDVIKSDFIRLSADDIFKKYHFEEGRDWKIADAKHDMISNKIVADTIIYRPLDFRSINYTGKPGVIAYPRYTIMRHLLIGENFALISTRQCKNDFGVFVTKHIAGHKSCVSYDKNSVFPLYLYPDENALDKSEKRRPNINMEIVNNIATKTGLQFTKEKENTKNTFAPIDILDYIYAVLYSNKYREKYSEFLRIDFPRVPYPANVEQFQKLSAIGLILRGLHLMENVISDTETAAFAVSGSNEVEKLSFTASQVRINKTQYFDNVTQETWEYFIGGYQPAQKWLKDRKGRVLSFEDIDHYQKIITILKLTIEIQQQIDEVIENV